ncbi:MAG: putative toxin-antitoxin system toxin component, PIN family [Paludibacteraceae bacterium]
MLLEYEEILIKFYQDTDFAQAVISIILASANTEQVDPSFRFRLITEDPDDNKFVDCAITCGATYIVSDDKHYNVLKDISFPATNVQKLKDFAKILNKSKQK